MNQLGVWYDPRTWGEQSVAEIEADKQAKVGTYLAWAWLGLVVIYGAKQVGLIKVK